MTAAQLKASILDLAIRGQLVPQDPNDEPAEKLLARIWEERSGREGDFNTEAQGHRDAVDAAPSPRGRARRSATAASTSARVSRLASHVLSSIPDEDKPFALPAGWTWCRFSDLANLSTGPFGSMLHKSDYSTAPDAIPLVNPMNIRCGAIVAIDSMKVSIKTAERLSQYKMSTGQLVMARRGEAGRCAIIEKENDGWLCGTGSFFISLLPAITPQYAVMLFATGYVKSYLIGNSVGSTMFNLNHSILMTMLLPLPPLAEQKRIVAKIEELMPLVKRYEAAEQKREKLDGEIAAKLKASLLDRAIRGQLVAQDPNDEPAAILLARIRGGCGADFNTEAQGHRDAVDAAPSPRGRGRSPSGPLPVDAAPSPRGRARRSASHVLSPIPDEDKPFALPAGWEWVRLGDICNYGSCESIEGASVPKDAWLLDLEEIEKDTGRLLARKTASQKESKSSKHVFERGVVLYSKLRTYLNKVLVAPEAGYCTTEIIPIRFFGGISPEYARLYLMSPMMLEYAASLGYGVKMPRLGTDDARNALFPLPPLAEQKRIVAKIEELPPLVAKLKT